MRRSELEAVLNSTHRAVVAQQAYLSELRRGKGAGTADEVEKETVAAVAQMLDDMERDVREQLSRVQL